MIRNLLRCLWCSGYPDLCLSVCLFVCLFSALACFVPLVDINVTRSSLSCYLHGVRTRRNVCLHPHLVVPLLAAATAFSAPAVGPPLFAEVEVFRSTQDVHDQQRGFCWPCLLSFLSFFFFSVFGHSRPCDIGGMIII